MDFKELIKGKDYDFLRTDEHLKGRICLLSLGGSYAYGTNKTDGSSDVDIRGIALERPSDIIGFSTFEQVVETNTDTTIYSFSKMLDLLIQNNPNTIEILGCKPEHYLFIGEAGQALLDNKAAFLSKNSIKSFVGYARAQLARLENALARDRLSQQKKEEHIANSIRNAMASFESRYTKFDENAIKLFVDESQKEGMDVEMFLDITLKHYPLRDFVSIYNEMANIERLYGKINHRNKKKDENHLDKHAMHLIRLYLMAIDIIEKQEIVTYREENLEQLKFIRHGGYRKEDGTYDDEFFDMLNSLEKRLEYAVQNTTLPDRPNIKLIEEIKMDVFKKIVNE